MPTKTVPLSVRITPEDSEFLARYFTQGATTPSEKLRSILSEEKKRSEGLKDYASCAATMEEMVGPAVERLRKLQGEKDFYSLFTYKLYDWLPHIAATMITGLPDDDTSKEDLAKFENKLADHVFELFQDVIGLGLSKHSSTADPDLINKRLSDFMDLIDLIQMKQQKRKEQLND